MPPKDPRLKLLSSYQREALNKFNQLLRAVSLSTDLLLEIAESEPGLVLYQLKNMTDQVVRSEVILVYTEIDLELDIVLLRHFFGKGSKSQRVKTFRLILQKLYPVDKLKIIRTFKDVPKAVVATIDAVNELRNGLAHNYDLRHLSASKRTYKKHNIFTAEGLELFHKDTREVREFLNPEFLRLVRKLSVFKRLEADFAKKYASPAGKALPSDSVDTQSSAPQEN